MALDYSVSTPQAAGHADLLLARVRRYCRQHALLSPGPLVVAVSGGADSVCLLHLLRHMAPEFGATLHVAHFNHALRGEEAAADARLVAALADRLGLPASFGGGDVAAAARAHRQSLEAAAHDMRWAFLEAVRRRTGATAITTGHTADDQAETVLMHLLRGSGLRGLAGMAPRYGTARRPLLALGHTDCLTWCREHGVVWREDASNAEPWCRRNSVRLDVLPVLRRYNPAIVETLTGTAESVQVDLAYLDNQTGAALAQLTRRVGHGVSHLDLAGYQALPESLRRHLLLAWLGEQAERVHLQAVDTLLREGTTGDAVAVPGRRQVVKQYADAVLSAQASPSPLPEVVLAVPGTTVALAWGWRVAVAYAYGAASTATPRTGRGWTVDLDADAVQLPLVLRSRRPGDRMPLLGMAGSKKLQDILVDAKVPRRERDHVGVLAAANGIVWLIGHRVAAGALAGPTSGRVLRVTVTPEAEEGACPETEPR